MSWTEEDVDYVWEWYIKSPKFVHFLASKEDVDMLKTLQLTDEGKLDGVDEYVTKDGEFVNCE